MVLAGPPGQPRQTNPVPPVILLGTLLQLGKKLPLVPNGIALSPIRLSVMFERQLGQFGLGKTTALFGPTKVYGSLISLTPEFLRM